MHAPTKEQLVSAAPIEIWIEAIKQAKRSVHKRHKTGCVIFDGTEVYSRGCSHTHNGGLKVRSVHAEMDALNHLYVAKAYSGYYQAVIVTLTKASNFAMVSKPCATCARLLERKVSTVIYAEKANDESWIVENRAPSSLGLLSATSYS